MTYPHPGGAAFTPRLEGWARTVASWFETRAGSALLPMRSSTSAAPIRRVTPGRDQKRHVEMAFGLAHRKAQWDAIEKRRIRRHDLPCGKIIADAEGQLVMPDRHRPAADQGPIGPAIRVGDRTRHDAVRTTLG